MKTIDPILWREVNRLVQHYFYQSQFRSFASIYYRQMSHHKQTGTIFKRTEINCFWGAASTFLFIYCRLNESRKGATRVGLSSSDPPTLSSIHINQYQLHVPFTRIWSLLFAFDTWRSRRFPYISNMRLDIEHILHFGSVCCRCQSHAGSHSNCILLDRGQTSENDFCDLCWWK